MPRHQLDYDATPRPTDRRPIWFAAIVVALLLLVLVLRGPVTNLLGRWQRQRAVAAMLQLQEACMRYSMPAGTLVLDHSPSTADTMRQPGYDQITDVRGQRYSHAAALAPPPLKDFQTRAAGIYNNLPLPRRGEGVAFMHERKTPSGTPVLIVAHVYSDGQPEAGKDPWYEIRFFRMLPATPTAPPRNADDWYNLLVSIQRPVDGVLQVRAGMPDPADPSHFVIPILKGRQLIDLHCWLRDDYKIKVRAAGGVVKQDDRCIDAAVYWSWPESIRPNRPVNRDFHRGLP